MFVQLTPCSAFRRTSICAAVMLTLHGFQFARAQCTQWAAAPAVTGANATVFAMTMWDPDGAGPLAARLVIAGEFSAIDGVPANNIAVQNGTSWSPMGDGVDGAVYSLAVLPNGTLVVGGGFFSAGGAPVNFVALWDGQAWSGLAGGMNNVVNAVAVLQSGNIVAGGFFTTAGGTTVARIAEWNGAGWLPLGSGADNAVYALLPVASGDLYVGGLFNTAGGRLVRRIARWDGTTWWPVGGGMNREVLSLGLMPNGDIVAGGQFTFPGGHVARWDGVAWSAMGLGVNGPIWAYAIFEDELVIGGLFTLADGVPTGRVARWHNNAWTGLTTGTDAGVMALLTLPAGDLMVGGFFTLAGDVPSSCLARWWTPPPPVLTQHPASVATCPAGSATFDVTASGSATPTYQWQAELDMGVWSDLIDGDLFHGGILIAKVAGATTRLMGVTTLTQFPLDRSLLALRCVATDVCGSVTSDVANLRVCAGCTGDVTCDCAVESSDLGVLLSNWQLSVTPGAGGDLNGDGTVGEADLGILLGNWQRACP
ncbi:MAG: hypothetical protein U1D55_04535 [Phycisphaerae bacterium]